MVCGKRPEDRFLAGIVMGGSLKCASHLPGFYTEVSKFREWIDSNLKKSGHQPPKNSTRILLHSKTFKRKYFVPKQKLQHIAKVLNIGKQHEQKLV